MQISASLALELHAGGSQCGTDALSKWFPPCLFNLTANCRLPGASQSVLGSSV